MYIQTNLKLKTKRKSYKIQNIFYNLELNFFQYNNFLNYKLICEIILNFEHGS